MSTIKKYFKKIQSAICSRAFMFVSLGLIAFSSCYYVSKYVDEKNSVRIQQGGNNAPSGASSGRFFYPPKITLFKTNSSPAVTEQSLDERQRVPAESAQISEQIVETSDIKEEVPQIPVESAAVEPVVDVPAVEPIVESVVEPTAVAKPAAAESKSQNMPRHPKNSIIIRQLDENTYAIFSSEDEDDK